MEQEGAFSWLALQSYLDGKFAHVEEKIDARINALDTRLRAVEGDDREQQGAAQARTKAGDRLVRWLQTLAGVIVGAFASHLIGGK